MSGRTLLYLTAMLVALALPGAQAFPTGAQVEQCDTMMPNHGSAQSQAIDANVPFTIVPSKTTYYGGERIMVTVNGTTMFKGLLLKAVTASSNAVGTFSLVNQNPPLQLLACSNMANSAVTHTDRNLKSAVSVYWTAPMSSAGDVTFRATVVQALTTFYVGLTSSPLTYMMKMDNNNNNNNNSTNMMTTESMASMTTTMNNNMNNNNNNMNAGNKGTVVAGSVAIVLVSMLFSRLP